MIDKQVTFQEKIINKSNTFSECVMIDESNFNDEVTLNDEVNKTVIQKKKNNLEVYSWDRWCNSNAPVKPKVDLFKILTQTHLVRDLSVDKL